MRTPSPLLRETSRILNAKVGEFGCCLKDFQIPELAAAGFRAKVNFGVGIRAEKSPFTLNGGRLVHESFFYTSNRL